MSEPVEKVLTYEALRSASAEIQTQAQHAETIQLLKCAKLVVPEITEDCSFLQVGLVQC